MSTHGRNTTRVTRSRRSASGAESRDPLSQETPGEPSPEHQRSPRDTHTEPTYPGDFTNIPPGVNFSAYTEEEQQAREILKRRHKLLEQERMRAQRRVEEMDLLLAANEAELQPVTQSSTLQARQATSEVRSGVEVEPPETPLGSDDDRAPDLSRYIKFDHEKLNTNFTYPKWGSWLDACYEMFESAPSKFTSDKAKITLARNKMDEKVKAMYRSRLTSESGTQAERLQNSWETFKIWSKSMIRQSGTLETTVTRQIERAYQKSGQDPRAFDAYLTQLETQRDEMRSDKERASLYFGKLRDVVQHELNKQYLQQLPRHRNEMVDAAAYQWELLSPSQRTAPSSLDRSERGNRSHTEKDKGEERKPPWRNRGNHRDSKRKPDEQSKSPPPNSKKPTGSSSYKDKDKKPIVCYRCNKPGHKAPDCWSKPKPGPPDGAAAQEVLNKPKKE
jgi:hypothetical protein